MEKSNEKLIQENIQAQYQNWDKNGVAIFRNVFSEVELNDYNQNIKRIRADIKDIKDEYGLGERIGQLHQLDQNLLTLASNETINKFLKWAFTDDTILFGSLNFEKGSQQSAHSDAIFFYPVPFYSMAGCWIALEDVHPDAGPLFFYPGSHKWDMNYSEDIVKQFSSYKNDRDNARKTDTPVEIKNKVVSTLGNYWTKMLMDQITELSPKVEIQSLKAGDVLLWHSLLIHGGSPRKNPALSRKSVVFHYIGKQTKLFTFEQFMLHDREDIKSLVPQNINAVKYGDNFEYMHYPYFVTYDGPNQIVHNL